jgi:hypothetical protein
MSLTGSEITILQKSVSSIKKSSIFLQKTLKSKQIPPETPPFHPKSPVLSLVSGVFGLDRLSVKNAHPQKQK